MALGVGLVCFVPVFGCVGAGWVGFWAALAGCVGLVLVWVAVDFGLCGLFLGLVLTLRAGLRTAVSVLKSRFGKDDCSTFFSNVGAKTSNSSRSAIRGHHGQDAPTNQWYGLTAHCCKSPTMLVSTGMMVAKVGRMFGAVLYASTMSFLRLSGMPATMTSGALYPVGIEAEFKVGMMLARILSTVSRGSPEPV